MSPRPLPKISLKHDWMKDLGSEVTRQPGEEVCATSKKFPIKTRCLPSKRSAPFSGDRNTFREDAVRHDRKVKPVVCRGQITSAQLLSALSKHLIPRFSREGQNLIFEDEMNHDRTGKPVVCLQEGAPQTRFSRDRTNFNVEDETNHDRVVKPVVCRDANHERSMLSEVDIDFRILDYHILLWNKLITIVFVSSWRRSRTTLTTNSSTSYNKTTPTTHSVRSPRKWLRTWAMWSCLHCSRQNLKRNAKSSIAPAGISWKKVKPTEAPSNVHWTFSQFQSA